MLCHRRTGCHGVVVLGTVIRAQTQPKNNSQFDKFDSGEYGAWEAIVRSICRTLHSAGQRGLAVVNP